MARVFGDPEEIKKFSIILQKYLENVTTDTQKMLSAFNQLGSTWQDSQRIKFEDNLKDLISILRKFTNETEKQLPHLRKLVEDLEAYQRR